jgi:PAS domain S-box-containing protein
MESDAQKLPFDKEALDLTAYLNAIVASSDDAIIGTSLDGTITSWNPAAERIFGFSHSEALGCPVHVLLPDDRSQEEKIILSRVKRGLRTDHFQTMRLRKDGSNFPASVTVAPLISPDGTVLGASQIVRDISDRMQKEAERQRLVAIVETSDDAIVSKSLDGIIQTWNPGAERIFGYFAEEIVGKSITILLPEDRQDEETSILSRIARGEHVDHFETKRVRKDGEEFDVSVTISPIKDSNGQVIGASKIARDISDQKRLEAAISRANQDLERRIHERTQDLELAHTELEGFAYSIAHDIRGPIRAIAMNANVLLEDFASELSPEASALVTKQIESTHRLDELIRALNDYFKVGWQTLNRTQVDISKIAQEVAQDTAAEYPNCVVDIQPNLVAHADSVLLRLIFLNLIGNACKFSPEGGQIHVGKKASTFYVSDEGVGFDMAYADRIFRPFERLHTREEFLGTGIGLASVKRIVEKHGGLIWVNSSLGSGTTFYFTIPDES